VTPLSRAIDMRDLSVLLCDADGNLFPSEPPAFEASAQVTNAFLRSVGVDASYAPEELRLATTGKNFRATAVDLCLRHGVEPGTDLEHWVETERDRVTEHLARVLRPDSGVSDPLSKLAPHLLLAAVSSSALRRLDACFAATGLSGFFPPDRTFSAEDSLAVPASKPDPAIYRLAGTRLGCAGAQGLAVEDSVAGAESAIAAGFPTVGNLQFVPVAERSVRARALRKAGVVAVVESWMELAECLLPEVGRP